MAAPTRASINLAIKAAVDSTQDTLQSVAECAGLDAGQLSRYCSGESMPNLINVWKLADELGLSIDELVGRKKPLK
jgi:transcriptional regulator with XRE-family HTH domain